MTQEQYDALMDAIWHAFHVEPVGPPTEEQQDIPDAWMPGTRLDFIHAVKIEVVADFTQYLPKHLEVGPFTVTSRGSTTVVNRDLTETAAALAPHTVN